jgi:hypothetical protein
LWWERGLEELLKEEVWQAHLDKPLRPHLITPQLPKPRPGIGHEEAARKILNDLFIALTGFLGNFEFVFIEQAYLLASFMVDPYC